jgi:hypothetical protein
VNGNKAIKAVCVPLAVALVSAPFLEAVTFENPHVDPRQHEEEPKMTFDRPPYTATSGAVLYFPLFGSGLESIFVSTLKK